MSIYGKKIAILVEADFEDEELTKPLKTMKEAGAEITVIGDRPGTKYRGKRRHAEIFSDISADKIEPDRFDAVIIPGGYAPDKMRLHQAMIDLVKGMFERGKLVAAVCHGPQLLISAGIVKGKRVTSWPSIAIDLKNAGARWSDEDVVIDGNLLTSRKPSDLDAFSKAIIGNLENR